MNKDGQRVAASSHGAEMKPHCPRYERQRVADATSADVVAWSSRPSQSEQGSAGTELMTEGNRGT